MTGWEYLVYSQISQKSDYEINQKKEELGIFLAWNETNHTFAAF